MVQNNIFDILEEIGINYFYHQVPNGKAGNKFLVYFAERKRTVSSDFENHLKQIDYVLEFYSKDKERETEKQIENILNEKGIEYESTENYIEKEKLYMTAYYFRLIEFIN